MKLLNTKSFKTKVLIFILGLTAFFIALVWFLQIAFLGNYYEYAKEKSVGATADEVQELVKKYQLHDLTDMIEEIAFNGSMCIELRDLDGKSFFTMDMAGRDCVIHSNKALLSTQLIYLYRQSPNKEMVRVLSSYKFDSKSFLLIREIVDYQGQPCLLWVSSPLVPVKSTIDILKQQFKLVIIIMLISGILLAIWLSSTLTRPIRKISEATKEVSKGNFNVRVKIKDRDEIGDMAANFNYMVNEISKVEATRQTLLANISHDLRTPLTMIKGYAETIKDITGDNPEKRNQQLDIIVEESDRLSLLVDDVLNYTTLSQDGYLVKAEAFNIGKLICDIVEHYRVITQGYQISFIGELGVIVYADKKRMEQVIYNLLNNAINHAGADRQVIIDLSHSKSRCKISITDHGQGIEAQHLPLIWDRYYKANKSGKRLARGTGLGLSIVKVILDSHGMPYGADSVVGKGSTFWFELALGDKV